MARGTGYHAQLLNSQSPTQRDKLMDAGGGLELRGYKPATSVVTNSAVMIPDPDLYLRLPVGWWFIELNANLLIANAANNIRYGLAGDEGLVIETGAPTVSLGRGFLGINGVAPQEDPIANIGSTITGGTTSAWTSLRIAMGMHVTQAGALRFMFAQNVAAANSVTILGGSVMVARKIAGGP